MADDESTISSSGDAVQDSSDTSGTSISMSDYPAIAQALQFSSSDELLASLGVSPSGSDDTATA